MAIVTSELHEIRLCSVLQGFSLPVRISRRDLFFISLNLIVIFCLKLNKLEKSQLLFNAALGIATEILSFRCFAEGKIEVKSPPLSFLRKGNAPIKDNFIDPDFLLKYFSR